MAYEQKVECISGPAGANLSTNQFQAVSFNSAGQLVLTAVGVVPSGVLQNKPLAQGQVASIGTNGISKVLVGAAGCNEGDFLQVDATGAFVTLSSGSKCAQALAAGTQGQLIPALLILGE